MCSEGKEYDGLHAMLCLQQPGVGGGGSKEGAFIWNSNIPSIRGKLFELNAAASYRGGGEGGDRVGDTGARLSLNPKPVAGGSPNWV